MNVISWETGESTIGDMPACADPFLARVVQRVNDAHCVHVAGGLLCPPCSVEVLALAHRTVGTALDWGDRDRANLYAKLAQEEADSVAHLRTADQAAAHAANAAACAAARAAAYDAAYAAYAAYAAAKGADGRLARAHAIIDRFLELTGITPTPPTPEVTEAAIRNMVSA